MTFSIPTVDDVDQVANAAAVAEYWERGYWISPQLFDDDQLQRLHHAHDRLWAGDYDHPIPSQYGIMPFDAQPSALRQQINAFWLNDEIRRAVTSPVLGAIGARLMGVESVRLWHDQVIDKPGTAGQAATQAANIGWHQDFGYWQACSTTNMCTAWVALQDTDLTNGGMRTIVGSHKWGLIEASDAFGHKDLERLAEHFAEKANGHWLDEPCRLKAGQVSFHHSLTFHGSGPNRSDQPRRCVIAHMMPGDTVYVAGRQWHPNLVFLGPKAVDGQPFIGDYWPVLWPVTASSPR